MESANVAIDDRQIVHLFFYGNVTFRVIVNAVAYIVRFLYVLSFPIFKRFTVCITLYPQCELKKRPERRKHCARAGCSKVTARPPHTHKHKHTHTQRDRTDYNTLRR